MGSAMRRSTAQFLAAEAGVIAPPPIDINSLTIASLNASNIDPSKGKYASAKLYGRVDLEECMDGATTPPPKKKSISN